MVFELLNQGVFPSSNFHPPNWPPTADGQLIAIPDPDARRKTFDAPKAT